MKILKRWLTDKGVTQRQFAEDIGVHETAVCQWLSGETKPTLANLQRIADITKIPVAKLLADLNLAA